MSSVTKALVRTTCSDFGKKRFQNHFVHTHLATVLRSTVYAYLLYSITHTRQNIHDKNILDKTVDKAYSTKHTRKSILDQEQNKTHAKQMAICARTVDKTTTDLRKQVRRRGDAAFDDRVEDRHQSIEREDVRSAQMTVLPLVFLHRSSGLPHPTRVLR